MKATSAEFQQKRALNMDLVRGRKKGFSLIYQKGKNIYFENLIYLHPFKTTTAVDIE